jgi:hypothetical protein
MERHVSARHHRRSYRARGNTVWPRALLDRIVVYSTAHVDAFTFADIQRTIADAALDFTADEIRESLARLTLAVVIDSDDGAHYRYCSPLFLEFLRTEDLHQSCAAAMAEAASAWRRACE